MAQTGHRSEHRKTDRSDLRLPMGCRNLEERTKTMAKASAMDAVIKPSHCTLRCLSTEHRIASAISELESGVWGLGSRV
eukprot:1560045-Rhodomonas_salina.1